MHKIQKFDEKNANLAEILVNAFADEEISIAKEGHNAFCKNLPNSPKITEYFFNPKKETMFDMMKRIEIISKKNDTVRMRIYDLFCSLSVLSPQAEEFVSTVLFSIFFMKTHVFV